jgi:hypothetical protein
MPTYINNSDAAISFGGVTFLPGVPTPIDRYVPYAEFSQTDNEPAVPSPILFSGEVTDDIVNIPQTTRRFLISVIADTDSFLGFSVDAAAGVGLKAGEAFELLTDWSRVRSITVSGTARIVIEEK